MTAPAPTSTSEGTSPLRQWTIDAFASAPFKGNSACVVEPLEAWPADAWMQRLASENGAGATAFLRRTETAERFGLRWFTPATEVPLCGHATLATVHALITELGAGGGAIRFDTASGQVTARRGAGVYELSFPRPPFEPIATPDGLAGALGATPRQVWKAPYLIALLDDPGTVLELTPRFSELRRISEALGGQGNVGVAALTNESADHDVVDRFFAPGYGFREDPATGSFHAILTPILAGRLPSGPIRFHQAYPGRGAEIAGWLDGDRVVIAGQAVTVAEAQLRIWPETNHAGVA